MSTTTQSQETFKITKDMLLGFCKKGFTVGQMAEKITAISGFKCIEAVVKRAAGHYKVDLRKKNRPSNFEFEDDSMTTTETEQGFTLS